MGPGPRKLRMSNLGLHPRVLADPQAAVGGIRQRPVREAEDARAMEEDPTRHSPLGEGRDGETAGVGSHGSSSAGDDGGGSEKN